MSILGEGSGSGYPAALDTAEQQTDGTTGTLADANWANDVTSAIVALQTELGTDPAGSLATVGTRLSTLINAAGGITSGTTANRPTAASGTFRLYWNTTRGVLEIIKDDASVVDVGGGSSSDHGALSGLGDDDHTQYGLIAGGRNYTGDIIVEKASPSVELKGTEPSAGDFRLYEDAGSLYLQEYSGAAWNTILTIVASTRKITTAAIATNFQPNASAGTAEGDFRYDSTTDRPFFYRPSAEVPWMEFIEITSTEIIAYTDRTTDVVPTDVDVTAQRTGNAPARFAVLDVYVRNDNASGTGKNVKSLLNFRKNGTTNIFVTVGVNKYLPAETSFATWYGQVVVPLDSNEIFEYSLDVDATSDVTDISVKMVGFIT